MIGNCHTTTFPPTDYGGGGCVVESKSKRKKSNEFCLWWKAGWDRMIENELYPNFVGGDTEKVNLLIPLA